MSHTVEIDIVEYLVLYFIFRSKLGTQRLQLYLGRLSTSAHSTHIKSSIMSSLCETVG